jgi:conjugative transfer pilus assembly protein TraH
MNKTSLLKKTNRSIISLMVGICALTPKAQAADFLRDFYDETLTNYSSPQEYKTATSNGFSGGSLYARWPQKSITPFTFTPPSFNMHGCRGIDLNMGAFSMINADAFVDMLRSIGQNAKGLFFQIALQAAAPELNSTLTSLSKTLQDFNKYFRNSCESAQMLLNKTGLSQVAKELGEDAKKWAVGSGTSSDAGKADTDSSDPSYIKVNQPEYTRSDGTKIKKDNKNYTWQAISDANFSAGLSTRMKEVMMSVSGTYIARWDGNTLKVDYKAPIIDDVNKLVGLKATTADNLSLYSCGLDLTCVSITNSDSAFKPLYATFNELLLKAFNNIKSRTDWLDTETLALFGRSHLPLGKMMDTLAAKYSVNDAQGKLSMAAQIMAVDFTRDFLGHLNLQLQKAIKVAEGDTTSRSKDELESLKKIKETIEKQALVAKQLSEEVNKNYADIYSFAQRHEYFSNALYNHTSSNTTEAARFGANY